MTVPLLEVNNLKKHFPFTRAFGTGAATSMP